jgi:Rha family phage regulatory protein
MNKDSISIRSGIEELGIFEKSGDAWVSSRDIAKLFEKQHKDVLAAIREQIVPNVSDVFARRNFPPSSYRNEQNKKQPEYLLNRKSFSMVVMGFTGKKAMAFKEVYIEAFEAMLDVINTRMLSKAGYKEMTSAISRKLKNDPRVFSIEADMINSIVLGMKAADFRAVHKIDDHGGTRDAVAYRKLDDLDRAQRLNAQLINAGISFEARKQIISSNFRRG